MRKQFLSIIIGTIVLAFLLGTLQAQTVTLTFTGKDANNNWVRLDRVTVTDLTKGWQETLIYPDTTLTMQNTTGIGESVSNGGFGLSQNNPNPFTGTTDVNLTMADAGAVTLEIVDGNGRNAVETRHGTSLQPGTHQFRISLSAAGTYVMTARQNGKTSSIKMVCNGAGNGNGIEYIGSATVETRHGTSPQPKSTTTNPFNFGDQMEYVGYATINGTEYESARISQMQGASQTFALVFAAVQHTIPTVTTNPVTNIGATSATAGGMVTSDGGENVFDRGVCYSTASLPTISDNCIHIGQGTGSFLDTVYGLLQETTYYVRAYATNSEGTAYGNEASFTTTPLICGVSTLTDIDGNVYNTIQIGNQCWMKENLRTKKYANGTPISQGSSTTSTTTAYWNYPTDSSSNMSTYGLLYNWKAVMGSSSSSSANPSGVQGICPTGWHMPSDAEWKQMEMAVGMSQSDADNTGWRGDIAAQLCGNTGWTSSSNDNAAGNTSAAGRNSSGFSALPAGYYLGGYGNFGYGANFWSSTEASSTDAYSRYLNYVTSGVYRNGSSKKYGYSVRCLKD